MTTDHSDYIALIDESGTPDMNSIDPDYPLFILGCCIFKKSDYTNAVLPKVADFKMRWFGHDQAILRSYDIRKAQGIFGFLTNQDKRAAFLDEMTSMIEAILVTIVAVTIKKDIHKKRYANPADPNDLALEFALERLGKHMQSVQESAGQKRTHVMIEKRGKKEDSRLELTFRRIMDTNDMANVAALVPLFLDKKANADGLQIADLCCHPVGQHIVNPQFSNRALKVILQKLHKEPNGWAEGYGIKTFP
jgi:hypothetical protein